MKKILSVVFGVIFLFSVTACSNKDIYEGTIEKKIIDYSDKIIKTGDGLTSNNKLVITAKNDSNAIVDIVFSVDFLDLNNDIISSDKSTLNGVAPGAEVAVQIYNTPVIFARYELKSEAKTSNYNKTDYNDIVVTDKRTSNVVAKIKNNSNETIDYVSASIIYFKDKGIVGYDSNAAFDIKSGKSGEINFFQPTDKSFNEMEYDNYKIYINEIYSYKYAN